MVLWMLLTATVRMAGRGRREHGCSLATVSGFGGLRHDSREMIHLGDMDMLQMQ